MFVLFLLCIALVFLGVQNTFKIIFGLLMALGLCVLLYVGFWMLLLLLAMVVA